jgi:hypothetical protein
MPKKSAYSTLMKKIFPFVFALFACCSPAIDKTKTTENITASLIQTELPTGLGDTNQRIIAVKVSATAATNPVRVSALKFTMTGTTNIADVTNIKVYSTGNNAVFNLDTATLFGTTKPPTGNLSVKGSQTLIAGDNYFWITYDVAAGATEGHLLDASCESIVANAVTYNTTANTVAGNREILLANTLLFTPGDAGSKNYRIPAIITAADGSLVTVTDKRWNHGGDLAAKIDPVVRRSTDMGKTWSDPLVIANFGGPNGAGDAALVLDKTTGNLLCLVSAEKGFFSIYKCGTSQDFGYSQHRQWYNLGNTNGYYQPNLRTQSQLERPVYSLG